MLQINERQDGALMFYRVLGEPYTQWRIQDFEKGGSSVYVTDHIKREARTLGVCGMWGHVPPGKFLISDLLRPLLVPFWGETARVGRPTAISSHCV